MGRPHETRTQSRTLLDRAVEYVDRGWSIISVAGKRACCRWKHYQSRAPDAHELLRLFNRPGVTGCAVILGNASGGLACRDYDRADAYQQWAESHPVLARSLPTVQTARGFHLYFAGPDGFATLTDGEYRANANHYCLLPPSLHPDGAVYRWIVPLISVLPVVDPVVEGLFPSQATHQTRAYPLNSLHVSTSDSVEEAILASMPTGPGQRNRRLFELARRLKSNIPDAGMDALESVVRDWHRRALPLIRTQGWLESWLDFRIAWAKVKRPAGALMKDILATAKAREPAGADVMARLTCLCEALQDNCGVGRHWPLSCRMAGKAIGVSHETAAKALKVLVMENIIELVKPAGPKGSRRAAEYQLGLRRRGPSH